MNQNHQIAGFTVVSLLTLGFGFYRSFANKEVKEDHQDLKVQEEEISKELENLNNLQSLLTSKAEDIDLKYSKRAPHVLATDCLKQILEFTSQIVDKDELETIFSNNRKARRSCFPQMKSSLPSSYNPTLQTYYRFVCTFNEELQYLIQKSQKDFVVFLNIDYSTITESIQYYTSQSDSQFAEWVRLWTNQIKQQLREQLPLYEQAVSVDKILDIAQYQIQVLTSQGDNLREAVRNLNLEVEDEQDAIPAFLQSFLEDIVQEKYSIQIEQTNLAAAELTPQLQQKFHILAELKNSVLQKMLNLQQSQQAYSQDCSQNQSEP